MTESVVVVVVVVFFCQCVPIKMIVCDRVFVALLTMVTTVYKNDTAKEYDANTFVE